MSQAVEDIKQDIFEVLPSDALEARNKTTVQRCAAKIPASRSLLGKKAHEGRGELAVKWRKEEGKVL